MSRPVDYYPEWYYEWLLSGVQVRAGEECAPAVLEALNTFHDAWIGDAATARAGFPYSHAQVRAYSLFYMSINMSKLWMMLERSASVLRAALAERSQITIADMGCGPATFTWALLLYLADRHPELLPRVTQVRGFDRNRDFLAVASRLGDRLRSQQPFAHLAFVWKETDWTCELQHIDETIVLIGNTLTELDELPDPASLTRLPAALVAIIEPGTRDDFHRLLPLRDAYMAADWKVNFPCTSLAPCPMGSDNWCHFHINRFGLPFIQRMAAKSGRDNPRHHFTGFLFSHAPTVPDQTWRVMSRLRRNNRSGIRWLCDGANLVEAVINRRAKSPLNQPFFKAEAGDMLRILQKGDPRSLKRTSHLGPEDAADIVDE